MKDSTQLSDDDQALLEAFVLGELTPTEAQALIRRLRQETGLRQEFQALQATLRLLPLGLPLNEPPHRLKDKVLRTHAERQRILALPSPNRRRLRSVSVGHASVGHAQFPGGILLGATALLIGLITLLGADNWRLRRALRNAEQNQADGVAVLLQRPNSRLVALEGSDENAAAGTVLFTPGQWQRVVVSLDDLPPLPPNQIYRLWLSLTNGDIIFCGEFNTDAQGQVFIELRPSEDVTVERKATGLFVTLETLNSPLEPTGEKIMTGTL